MSNRSLMFVSSLVLSFCAVTIKAQLTATFYQSSCPNVSTIVRGVVQKGIISETRMAASLLRLHFHDCFVNSGGPFWKVLLGRRDSTTANQTGANVGLPAPFDPVTTIIQKFTNVGLSATDVVPLSGGHTIGRARCTTFNNRLFDFNTTGSPDSTIDPTFLSDLQTLCPVTGDNNTLAALDRKSKDWFDNNYFKELKNNSGLLQSDQELYATDASTKSLVDTYISSQSTFFQDFVTSMIRMGNISPLTGTAGQIRTNCRVVN
eukprot:PITA_01017